MFFMPDREQPSCVIPLHTPSLKEYAFFLLSGIVVSIPFALFFEQLSEVVPAILSLVILAPFIEELAKVFPLFYRHGETERSIVNLGLLLGLGFGITEFALYVFVGGVPFTVRLPGIIFHASSATIVAYGVAKKNPWPYYLIAAMLHVANNLFAEISSLGFGILFELVILISTYMLAWNFYRKTSKEKIVV
jgi:RsiW-degrading membrane proteinase PrsW (M82 family)